MLANRVAKARVLMFHGIGDSWHSAELLEQKIIYLKKYFRIISIDQLLEMMSAGQSFTNEIVLTFDDGLRNNAVHAYPILRKHNVPATFYLCPGLIDSGDWVWNQEARERLRTLTQSDRASITRIWGCNDTLKDIIVYLKTLDIVERGKAVNFLRERTRSFEPTAIQKNNYDIMTWEDVFELDKDLITFGSHTTNHVIAKNLSDETINVEIVESKLRLEAKLGYPIEHFCYPNGDFDRATVSLVNQHYKSAVTTMEGLVDSDDDLHLLNRIPSDNTLAYFAWRLFRPAS